MRRPIPILLAVALAALLAALPAAAVTVEPQPLNGLVPPGGSAPFHVEVTVPCLTILEEAGSVDVELSLQDAPGWAQIDAEAVTLDATACLVPGGSMDVRENITASLLADGDAPGLAPTTLTVVATAQGMGDGASGEGSLPGVLVDYRPGHAMSPPSGTTFEVTEEETTVPLEIAVTANAETMVMFEGRQVDPPGAGFGGLVFHTFDVAAGQRTHTMETRFTAPTNEWDEVTVRFTHFSHCIPPEGAPETLSCDPLGHEDVVWTFVNAGVPPQENGDGDGEDSPGAALILVALLVLLVAATRRK